LTVYNLIVAAGHLLQKSAFRRPEKRVLGLTSERKAGSAQRLSFLIQSPLGPLTDAGVAGLRRVFRDDVGLLHTIFSANGLLRVAHLISAY
jgi:hypothetical protein